MQEYDSVILCNKSVDWDQTGIQICLMFFLSSYQNDIKINNEHRSTDM